MIKNISKILILIVTTLAMSACSAGFVTTKDFDQPYFFSVDEESKIPDNDTNIEILKIVQKYRDAMANKDIATLKSMVSKDYYENASTTDDLSDDYGNELIEEILNDYLSQSVKDIRYSIEIKQLTNEGLEYYVDYQYIWNFRYEIAGQSYWQSKNDTNRLTLVQEDEEWKIKSGL